MALLPLAGVRVLDLTWYTAGPFCTRMLADYGAEVLKIERPSEGDPARRLGPFYHDEPGLEKSGLFLLLNTSKRSMTLDLKTERGRQIVKELVRRTDVLVESFNPRVMPSLGLSYEALREVNPRLVMTSVSNFGQTGPYRDWEATDLTLYAMGGTMFASGDPDLEPVKTAGRMATFHVGYAAALATAIALWAARRTGQSQRVDLSGFEAHTQSIDGRLGRLMGYQHTKQVVKRVSPASSMGLGSGVYQCSDGYVSLASGAARFPQIARMVGADYLLEQPEWRTLAARSRPDAAEEFDALLVPWCLERTKDEIKHACIRSGVLGAPMNTIADLLEDEHFVARAYFQTIDHPAVGPLVYPGYQFRLHTATREALPPRRPAPLLGQHTTEVLQELGYDDAEVARLRAQGVV